MSFGDEPYPVFSRDPREWLGEVWRLTASNSEFKWELRGYYKWLASLAEYLQSRYPAELKTILDDQVLFKNLRPLLCQDNLTRLHSVGMSPKHAALNILDNAGLKK